MRFIDEWKARRHIAMVGGGANFDKSVALFWYEPETNRFTLGAESTLPAQPSSSALMCHCVMNIRFRHGHGMVGDISPPDRFVHHIHLFIGIGLPMARIPPLKKEAHLKRWAVDLVEDRFPVSLIVRSGGLRRLRKHVVITTGSGHHRYRYQQLPG